MKTPYDDIIHLPHHVSQHHPQMPMLDRAAQFAPFAAFIAHLPDHPESTIEYHVPNDRKSGGAVVTVVSRVRIRQILLYYSSVDSESQISGEI